MKNCSIVWTATLAVALAACGGSGGSTAAPVEVAAATIGPDGGTIEVVTGAQAGMRLTIPAGALLVPTQFRIIDESPTLPPEIRATSYAPLVGMPFRIEPNDVAITADASLRLPYLPRRIFETARSNVRLRRASAFSTVERTPDWVDIDAGLCDVRLREFGSFQVVVGPRIYDPVGYLPQLDEVAVLEDGYEFSITEVEPPTPFVGERVTCWRITGPDIDESLIFDRRTLLGRESDTWREIWAEPYDTFTRPPNQIANGMLLSTIVDDLSGSLLLNGQIIVVGYRTFSAPRTVGDRLVLDVLELTIELGYDRPDLGAGTREFTFWFGPGEGLLGLAIDGIDHRRVP